MAAPERTRADEEAITAALREAGAQFAYLHGSVVAGTASADSDVDVAAFFAGDEPAPWRVRVPPGVDLLVLDSAPLELAGRVALHGRLLFDDDPPARVRWEATTRKIYLDERHRPSVPPRISSTPSVTPRPNATMVDAQRLTRLLTRGRQDLTRLRGYADADRSQLRGDEVRLGHIK